MDDVTDTKSAKVVAFGRSLINTLPSIAKRAVIGKVNPALWPSITHIFPNALLSGSQDPLDFQLQGRKMTIFCPARMFPQQMQALFGSAMLPCPLVGHNKHVTPDAWPSQPRRYCDSDEVAYLWASSWRCACGKPATTVVTCCLSSFALVFHFQLNLSLLIIGIHACSQVDVLCRPRKRRFTYLPGHRS